MCGIFGYIGDKEHVPELILEGLKTLEYRGYDSWGVAVSVDDKILVEKKVGKIGEAKTTLPDGKLGIGHTRWATHGGVTEANAHPHLDPTGRFAVIHNGIIENHHELKLKLHKQGSTFISETDTELLAHLMASYIKDHDFKEALRLTFNDIVGSNAFCVLDNEQKQIGVCRDGSPVVIGIGKEEYFVGSDVTPFLQYTHDVIFLDDGQAAVISTSGAEVFNLSSGDIINAPVTTIDWEAEDAKKDGHPHFLIKEILEQKKTISQTSQLNHKEILKTAEKIRNGNKVVIAACGTAAFCGFAAQYYFAKAGISADAFGAYEILPFMESVNDQTVFIAISQSGETADTLIAVKEAKKRGAHIVAIINARGSTLERLADTVILVGTGPEISVVSTKAFTAQLATLYQIAQACIDEMSYSNSKEKIKKLEQIIDVWLNSALQERIKDIAKELILKEHVYIIGKHLNYRGSMECAMKIKETSYIHAESFAAGELKHGVIALIDKDTPCIVLGSDDETKHEVLSSASEMKARGGYIIGIAPFSGPEFDYHIQTPDLQELTILGNVIVGQLLGYYMAIGRGADPDKPRNLAKSVTVK